MPCIFSSSSCILKFLRITNNARSTIVQDTINSSSTWMTHLVLAACFKTLMIVFPTRKIRCFWPQDSWAVAGDVPVDGWTDVSAHAADVASPFLDKPIGWFHLSKCSPVSTTKVPRRRVCKLNRPCALYMCDAPRSLSLARSSSH